MANYLLVYKGGGMPEPSQREAVMAAWRGWFGQLGEAVVDGGSPFSNSKSLAADGSSTDRAGSDLTGYSIVAADNLDAATKLAKGCPILQNGGTVDIYETVEIL